MAVTEKLSSLVQRQFPAFYQEEGEKFLSFVKAYYESESPFKKSKPKMTKEMGYISNVKDARKVLEDIFKNS